MSLHRVGALFIYLVHTPYESVYLVPSQVHNVVHRIARIKMQQATVIKLTGEGAVYSPPCASPDSSDSSSSLSS